MSKRKKPGPVYLDRAAPRSLSQALGLTVVEAGTEQLTPGVFTGQYETWLTFELGGDEVTATVKSRGPAGSAEMAQLMRSVAAAHGVSTLVAEKLGIDNLRVTDALVDAFNGGRL